MIERTEEQIKQDLQMVATMRQAQANMQKALARIDQLTECVKTAADYLRDVQKYLPELAYVYNTVETVRHQVKGWEAEIRRGI